MKRTAPTLTPRPWPLRPLIGFLYWATLTALPATWPVAVAMDDEPAPPVTSAAANAFMQSRLEDYRAELEAMRRYYTDHGGEDLPSATEIFLSGKGLKQPRTPMIFITRNATSDPLWKPPKEYSLDNKGSVYLRSFRIDVPIANRGLATRLGVETPLILAADDLTADVLGVPRSCPIALPGSWVRIVKKGEIFDVSVQKTGDIVRQYGAGAAPSATASKAKAPAGSAPSATASKAKAPAGADGAATASKAKAPEGDVRAFFAVSVTSGKRGGVKVNRLQTRAFCKKISKFSLVASASECFAGLVTKGSGAVAVKLEPHRETLEGTGVQVTRVGLMGEDIGPKEDYPMACFLGATRGGLDLHWQVGVRLTAGYKKAQVLALDGYRGLRAKVLSGDSFRLAASTDGRIHATATGRPGETKFRVEIGPASKPMYSKPYTLSALRARIEIDPEPLEGYRILAGEEYQVRLVLDGGGDADRLKGRWEPLLRGKDSGAIQVEGAWDRAITLSGGGKRDLGARNRLRVKPESLPPWEAEDLESRGARKRIFATVAATFEERTVAGVYRVAYPERLELLPPTLTGIGLRCRSGDGEWQDAPAKLTFFTTSASVRDSTPKPRSLLARIFGGKSTPEAEAPKPSEMELAVNLTFSGGTPLLGLDPEVLGFVEAETTGDASKLLEPYSGRLASRYRVLPAPVNGGKLSIAARVSWYAALAHGVPVAGPEGRILSSNEVDVTVNRLVLSRQPSPGSRTNHFYQLIALGPANMAGYRAAWHVRRASASSAFRKRQGGLFSATTHARSLRRVDVLNPQGTVVATLAGDRDVDMAPQISLEIAPSARKGEEATATAVIAGVPTELLGHTFCRWSITPAVGTFRPARTSVAIDSYGQARSATTLVLNAGAAAGKKAKVAVEVVVGD